MRQDKKRADTAYKIKILRIMSAYAAIMLAMLAAAIFIPRKAQTPSDKSEAAETPAAVTEYVYIRADGTAEDGESAATEEVVYTVREHEGQIGIFLSDGTLAGILDVNVKTLPEADRRLLGEGIEVSGKKRLNSLIEDYTG